MRDKEFSHVKPLEMVRNFEVGEYKYICIIYYAVIYRHDRSYVNVVLLYCLNSMIWSY